MDVNLATRPITSAPISGDILLLVDGGDDGNNTGQDTDAVHTNPADGLDAATGGGSGDGPGQSMLAHNSIGEFGLGQGDSN